MDIKNNLANIVSVTRIFVAYIAIGCLYMKTTWAYLLAFILTVIAFSMDGLVYYPTLEEYKVCPAIMVQAKPGDAVLAPADGVVSKIAANEEIGTYLCVTLGDEYQAIIGNMDNVSVAEGDYVLKGTVLGGLAEPTKYYVTEGPNLYFELQKNGEPVDPLDYLE